MGRRTARPGEASRADYELPVRLRFKHLGEFIDELVANVSTGGMFIRTARPHPVGSVFEFQLGMGDGGPPVDGKAQVAWIRRRSDHPGEPAGMGVRFAELDDSSRRRLAEQIAAPQEADGGPIGVEPPADDAPADDDGAAADVPSPDAGASDRAAPRPTAPARPTPAANPPLAVGRAAAAASESRRPRLAWLAAAAVLAVVLAYAIWRRPAADPPGEPRPAAAAAVAVEEAAPRPPGEPLPAAEAARPAGQAETLESWALAWSEQRIEDYLDVYSPRFVPSDGLDRASWQRQRRARILAPQTIHVGLAFVEVEEVSEELSRVRFVQSYESDSYSDVVRKVIDLERGADGWKILREAVEP